MADVTIIDDLDRLELGCGYDPSTGSVCGRAIEFKARDSVAVSAGDTSSQEFVAYMRMVESSSDFEAIMDLDFSASVRTLAGSARGKMAFRQRNTISTYTATLICKILVRNAVHHVVNPRIVDPTIVNMYKNDSENFLSAYGTHYIGAELSGGEYCGLIRITTEDRSDHNEIRSQMNGGTLIFQGSASLANRLEAVCTNRQTSMDVYCKGGVGLTVPTTIEEMLAQLKAFPGIVKGPNAAIFGYIAYPYTSLGLGPGPNPILLGIKRDLLQQLSRDYEEYRIIQDDLNYIAANRERFMAMGATQFTDLSLLVKSQTQKAVRKILLATEIPIGKIEELTAPDPTTISPLVVRNQIPEWLTVRTYEGIRVYARDATWQNTGVRVRKGQLVTISAPGSWSVGKTCDASGLGDSDPGNPAYPFLLPSARFGALVGSIGNTLFEIGTGRVIVAETAGELRLACNDSPTHPRGFKDNDGSLCVKVVVGASLG